MAFRGASTGAASWAPILGAGLIGAAMHYRGEEMIFPDGPFGVVISAVVYTLAAWVVIFFIRAVFIIPFQLWSGERSARIVAEKQNEAELLTSTLSVSAPLRVQQFRPTADFKKIPIEFVGWMFKCPSTLTNRSAKSKLALEISVRMKMKPPFPSADYVLGDLGSLSGGGNVFWKYQDQLNSPLSLDIQEAKTGTLYFWTGPMINEQLRETLSDLIEKDSNCVPVAFLDVKNLITDETISVRIPTPK
jgi:hypothetical protein